MNAFCRVYASFSCNENDQTIVQFLVVSNVTNEKSEIILQRRALNRQEQSLLTLKE